MADTIRPFQLDVSDKEVADLRQRIASTRWPERETVDDASQGVQLATLRELARYWATEYDFGRLESRLNALPQFMTRIDGLDIHFIHVRSPHEDALPLIATQDGPAPSSSSSTSSGRSPTRRRTAAAHRTPSMS